MKKRILAVVLVLAMALALTGCNSSDYKKAVESMDIGDYAAASAAFKALADYKDSAALADECDYLLACDKLDAGDYAEAKELFESISDYEDSAELILECDYLNASELLENGEFEGACELFEALGDYKDSTDLLKDAQTAFLRDAVVGSWISEELDASEFMMSVCSYTLGADAEIFEYCPLTDFILIMKCEFAEDGTLIETVDEDSFLTAMGSLEECIKAGFGDYLLALLDELAAEQGTTLEEMGLVRDADVLVQDQYGMSVDELFDELFDVNDLAPTDDFTSEGTWEIEDGKVRIDTNGSTEYAEYDAASGQLTFTGEGLEDSEQVEMLYPLIFNKA